jgi:hypothetical protein
MALRLPKEMAVLLREIIESHRPEMLGILDSPEDSRLTEQQRDHLRQEITDEFCRTGLQANDEPNQRGLLLEELVDRLGHL